MEAASSSEKQAPPCSFAVRLVDIDVENARPTELDLHESKITGKRLRTVPVVRIFGATPRGQKVLLHVHGAFRYFLIPFDGEKTDAVALRQLAEELETEMRRTNEKLDGRFGLVVDMTLEQLTPFYGYHETPRTFLRVVMATPGHVDLAARLFSRGFCHRLPRQPHEAHVGHLLQFKVDHNCLGMDFVRLARVRWRGALPEHANAVPLSTPPPTRSAGGASGRGLHSGGGVSGASGGSGGSIQASSRLSELGFRCVWTRGHVHGLGLQSAAERIGNVELEADATCSDILNSHDVIYEPLAAARADVRLCQSLNQIWRDENARRDAIGLPRLEDGGNAATPHSAAAKRSVLPPLPARLAAELRVIDGLLAAPPPDPPAAADVGDASRLNSTPGIDGEVAGDGGAVADGGDGGRIRDDLSEILALDEADGGRGGAAAEHEAVSQVSRRSSLGGDSQPDSQPAFPLESTPRAASRLSIGSIGGASQLSADGASLAAHLDDLCSSRPSSNAGGQHSRTAAAIDAEVYKSGGASQGHSYEEEPEDAIGGPIRPIVWPGGGELGEDLGGNFFGSDEPELGHVEMETVEVEVEQIRRMPAGTARQREAERIELAVLGVLGVTMVSVSEQTGTVQVEASAARWLQEGKLTERFTADEFIRLLEQAVLDAIASVKHEGRRAAAGALEAEIEASQMEMQEVMQHVQHDSESDLGMLGNAHAWPTPLHEHDPGASVGFGDDGDGHGSRDAEVMEEAYEAAAADDDEAIDMASNHAAYPEDAAGAAQGVGPDDDDDSEGGPTVEGLALAADAAADEMEGADADGGFLVDGDDFFDSSQWGEAEGNDNDGGWAGGDDGWGDGVHDGWYGQCPSDEDDQTSGEADRSVRRVLPQFDGSADDMAGVEDEPPQVPSRGVSFEIAAAPADAPMRSGVDAHGVYQHETITFDDSGDESAPDRGTDARGVYQHETIVFDASEDESEGGAQAALAPPSHPLLQPLWPSSPVTPQPEAPLGALPSTPPRQEQATPEVPTERGEIPRSAKRARIVAPDDDSPRVTRSSLGSVAHIDMIANDATAGEAQGVHAARPMSPKYEGYQEGCPSLVFRGGPRTGGPLTWADGDESDDEDEGGDMPSSSAPRFTSSAFSMAQPTTSSTGQQQQQPNLPLHRWLEAEDVPAGTRIFRPLVAPPSVDDVASAVEPHVLHRAPFFGVASDIPDRYKVVHNRVFHLDGSDALSVCEFHCPTPASEPKCVRCRRGLGGGTQRAKPAPPPKGQYRILEPLLPPPSSARLQAWLDGEQRQKQHKGAALDAARRGGGGDQSGVHGRGGSSSGARLVQDPNTGRLRPIEPPSGGSRSQSYNRALSAGFTGAGGQRPLSQSSSEAPSGQELRFSMGSSQEGDGDKLRMSQSLSEDGASTGGEERGVGDAEAHQPEVAVLVRPWLPQATKDARPPTAAGHAMPPPPPHGKAAAANRRLSAMGVTQVSPPTASDPPPAADVSELHTCQSLTVLMLEIHVNTRGHMHPNAGHVESAERVGDSGDEVEFVWFAVKDDMPAAPASSSAHSASAATEHPNRLRHGLILRVDKYTDEDAAKRAVRRYRGLLKNQWKLGEKGEKLDTEYVRLVHGEKELLTEVAQVVRHFDADVLLTWDARASLGFLLERAGVLGVEPPLIRQLGRTHDYRGLNEERHDEWGERTNTGIKIVGRILLNAWRCARTELSILSFTVESVATKVLNEVVPAYSHRTLTQWWNSGQAASPAAAPASVAAAAAPVAATTPADAQADANATPALAAAASTAPMDAAAAPATAAPAAAAVIRAPAVAAASTSASCPMLSDEGRVRVLSYCARRVSLTLRICEAMEVLPRTSELARVFGIDFTSVITRGSQYRVESMLLRLCRSQGYAVASPDQQQVKAQAAPQSIALVMEPEGKFYTSPVIVLDFRSLYPSVIIAYNYCYSTCLGPVRSLTSMLDGSSHGGHRFGCLDLSMRGFCTAEEAEKHRSPAAQVHAALTRLAQGRRICPEPSADGSSGAVCSGGDGVDSSKEPSLSCGVHAAPNGVLFTSATSRPGILPRLLREILETRFMVKRAMKQVPVGSALHRTLNARQFGLKLIANVTYGYTSASFSGRMPNVHIADAIVQTGRDTLQRTVDFVDNHPTWGARVVYGDTDSLFVLCEGKSRAEAFAVGRDIAKTVTAINPHPMELEMEKVYHPCVLCTKKRYVGWMYESEDSAPSFDAKGIETVRRDGCGAERKVLEKCLRLLFTSGDLSAVKSYLLRQCDKIQSGRASLMDLVFASEVRLGTYKSNESAPAGAQVAMHREQVDPNDKVQLGERVPYVIINRPDGDVRLRTSAQRPEMLLFTPPSASANALSTWRPPEPNAPYYILKKLLPAIHRIFSLIGVDVFQWYKLEMKRTRRPPLDRPLPTTIARGGATIVGYFDSEHCVLCDKQCRGLICDECMGDRASAMVALRSRHRIVERRYDAIVRHCMSCAGVRDGPVECRSLDCPNLFSRIKLARHAVAAAAHLSRGTLDW